MLDRPRWRKESHFRKYVLFRSTRLDMSILMVFALVFAALADKVKKNVTGRVFVKNHF